MERDAQNSAALSELDVRAFLRLQPAPCFALTLIVDRQATVTIGSIVFLTLVFFSRFRHLTSLLLPQKEVSLN